MIFESHARVSPKPHHFRHARRNPIISTNFHQLPPPSTISQTQRLLTRIEDCYRGEDCWLGAYDGAEAHGGLDINHPPGTAFWGPLDLDDHFLFHRVDHGHINNRWRGIRRWPNGSEWILQTCHMTALTAPERQPLQKGQQSAVAAGVAVGAVPHTHFDFRIHDDGETYLLDPWILFWQMYQDAPAASSAAG